MSTKFIDWNLNNKIKFKMPQTQEAMRFASEQLWPKELEEVIMSKDKDGWYTMQAHEFFRAFGEKLFNGSDWQAAVQIEVSE